jgi:pentapeptide MXKDX repeat protein
MYGRMWRMKERMETNGKRGEGMEKEGTEKERMEKEGTEKERMEKEGTEKERMEKEGMEKERMEKETNGDGEGNEWRRKRYFVWLPGRVVPSCLQIGKLLMHCDPT